MLEIHLPTKKQLTLASFDVFQEVHRFFNWHFSDEEFLSFEMIDSSRKKKLIVEFIEETHTHNDFAVGYLQENDWNLEVALERFKNCKCIDESKSSTSSYSFDGCPEKTENGVMNNWNLEIVFRIPAYGFVLPNLSELPAEFRDFLEKDLIETSTLKRLERHLNWWYWNGSSQRLWPLSTTGDGNCLLHAASLGMWGIHDRQLILRSILHQMLTSGSRRHTLWRRWRWVESKINLQSGLVLNEDEWQHEWNNVLNMAATTPRSKANSENEVMEKCERNEQIYESLEAIHVFALAHILKRPIIVVSDTVLRNAAGEELAPIPFGGIYLPLECPASKCHRSPLVLCYDSAHFSAVVPMRNAFSSSVQPVIPITDKNRNLLPIHFSVDPGPDFTWWKDADDLKIASKIELSEADQLSLMCEYMDITKILIRKSSVRRSALSESPSHRRLTAPLNNGNEMKNYSSNILNEISQQLRKRFKFRSRKFDSLDDGLKTVTINDLHCNNLVLAARLYSHEHQYMEYMVENYLASARERFEQAKNTPSSVNRQRSRISSSFSTSSLSITCINNGCQQPASPTTNFLCNSCFDYQRHIMTSFGCNRPGYLRSLRSHTTESPSHTKQFVSVKSNTMPSFSISTCGTDDAVHLMEQDRKSSRISINTGESSLASSCCGQGGNGAVHTISMHFAERPSEYVTTRVSSKMSENGITHYFLSM
ncbi:unnamed protein product [Dracunculus medinensis]|uniref:ubiquitinyl hydrolase 1 n=1 Tax=Dracunculus medinensis TaxID=318479 RepID=A0A0N4UHF5_DRAME|nr:unnamed protein product [Dracunculus medinensis]